MTDERFLGSTFAYLAAIILVVAAIECVVRIWAGPHAFGVS